jgi:hypothetical protein
MEEGRGSSGDDIRKINIDGNSLGGPQPTKQFAVFVHPRLETDADISPRDNVLLAHQGNDQVGCVLSPERTRYHVLI